MEDNLTINELEKRWENVLMATEKAVNKNPGVYHKLKSLTQEIVGNPLDINDYMPTAKKLSELLMQLDTKGQENIFNLFSDRIIPSTIWKVTFLRMECKDLLDHLKVFDNWRMRNHNLQVIK